MPYKKKKKDDKVSIFFPIIIAVFLSCLVVHFQVKTTSHLIPFPTLIMASSRLSHDYSTATDKFHLAFSVPFGRYKEKEANVIYISLVIRFTTYSTADCIMDTFPICSPSMLE